MRTVLAKDLKSGDVMALPMGRTATVTQVKVGSRYIHVDVAGYPKTRMELDYEVMLEDEVNS